MKNDLDKVWIAIMQAGIQRDRLKIPEVIQRNLKIVRLKLVELLLHSYSLNTKDGKKA